MFRFLAARFRLLGRSLAGAAVAAALLSTPGAALGHAELSYRTAYGVAGTTMPPFAGILIADERADLIGYLRDRADDQ